ncbi:MAG: hypothetical protein D3909_12605 [Candidatus Electrothrix sp. ATG1]|nr:hypothetical protein [Candidatus Electrothrix sp. ATG1]
MNPEEGAGTVGVVDDFVAEQGQTAYQAGFEIAQGLPVDAGATVIGPDLVPGLEEVAVGYYLFDGVRVFHVDLPCCVFCRGTACRTLESPRYGR